jgi:type II secretory pathway pseudopilin PulG
MPRYQPNLRDKVHPDAEMAIQQLYDAVNQLRAARSSDKQQRTQAAQSTQKALQQVQKNLSSLPGYDFFNGGNSTAIKQGQVSVLPTVSGALSYTNDGNNINWSWAGKKQRWPNRDVDNIPDGAQPVGSLTPSTAYTFYPRFSLFEGVYKFTSTTNAIGTPTPVAYVSRDEEATQAQSFDSGIALSIGGMQASTTSGAVGPGGSGGGSGCIHGEMVAEDENGRLVRFENLRKGGMVVGPSGINVITGLVHSYESMFMELFPRLHGERPLVTPMHSLCWRDAAKHAVDWACSDFLIGRDREWIPVEGTRLREFSKKQVVVSIEVEPDHCFFFGERTACILSKNIPVGK